MKKARKCEEKIKSGNIGNLVREDNKPVNVRYGMEREGYYNENRWGIESKEVMRHGNKSFEKNLINRERDLQRQWEREKIDRLRYNKRYKE